MILQETCSGYSTIHSSLECTIDSPAIENDGTIYVPASAQGVLFALAPDGTELWRFEDPTDWIRAAAVSDNGVVYVGSRDESVYAVETATGDLLWRFEDPQEWVNAPVSAGSDGNLYFGTYGLQLWSITSQGEYRWDTNVGGTITSGIAFDSNARLFTGSQAGNPGELLAYTLDGDESFLFTAPGGRMETEPVVGQDGTVYIGSRNPDSALYAVNPDGTEKWRFEEADGEIRVAAAIGDDDVLHALFTSSTGPADAPWPMSASNRRRDGHY